MVTTITSTSVPLDIGRTQVFQEVYRGGDREDYMIVVGYRTDSNTDSIFAFKIVNDVISYEEIVTGLTKDRNYTFCIHKNRVYFSNGIDAIQYAVIDSNSVWTTAAVTNAPLGEFVISAKNMIWLGGQTTDNYNTGTALFTNGSPTVTGTLTEWEANARAGDLIGTGVAPVKYYTIGQVVSDTQIELTENYAEATTLSVAYNLQRISDDVIYYSAEQFLNDWQTPGVFAGIDQSFVTLGRPNTGLHNFSDAVVLGADIDVNYLEGILPSQWRIPKQMRLPIGVNSHYSLVSKEGYIGLMTDQGYFVSRGGRFNIQELEAKPISYMVSSKFNEIDQGIKATVQSSIFKEYLFVSIPSEEVYDETDRLHIYNMGRATVADASPTVTGTGTLWWGNVKPGDFIRFEEEAVQYEILSVDSPIQITLTANKSGLVTSGKYVILKRTKNRIMVLDTRTNLTKTMKLGWTVYDNIFPNGFVTYKDKLIYGSGVRGSIFEYNIGGRLYNGPINATATTKRFIGDKRLQGTKKYFKGLWLSAKGTGVVFITPIVDGKEGNEIYYEFTDTTQYEEIYFPNANNSFSYIGKEIQFRIDCRGKDEALTIMPLKCGFIPISRRN